MLEEESEEIRGMGQWNPSIFDNSYSAKLPLGPMRKLAGFTCSNKMYYNPRTTLVPEDESLLRATPLGKWCYDALEGVVERSENGENPTAIHTLKFFCEINKIFLQDAAAMLLLHPERADHPLFNELTVFSSSEFKVGCSLISVAVANSLLTKHLNALQTFKDKMACVLRNSQDPADAALDTVLPGVHQWHQATNDSIKANTSALQALDDKVDTLADRIDEGLTAVVNHLDNKRAESDRHMAATFMSVAQSFLQRTATTSTPSTNQFESPAPACLTGTLCDVTGEGTPMSNIDMSGTPDTGASDTLTQPDHPDYRNYRMVKKHKSLDEMWDEWHGTGRFADDIGGIKGRNKHFGAKWRKHIEGQHYSRTKCIIDALNNYAENNQLKVEEATAVMNKWFVDPPVSSSLTKMKQLCVEKGLLKKGKLRGKQCKKQQQLQEDAMEVDTSND